MRSLRSLLATVIIGYLVLVGYLYMAQRSLIYPAPSTAPVLADYGLSGFNEVIYDTADGLALTGWYKAATPGQPTLVIFHGNAGDLAQRGLFAQYMAQYGYGTLLTSYRGYPPNPGRPSEDGLYADANAALAYLAKAGVKNKDIIVFGASLGSGPATDLAHRMATSGTPARALYLEVPFTDLAAPAAAAYWYVPVRHLLLDTYDNIGKIASINTRVCIIAAGNDTVVPNEQAQALYHNAQQPKHITIIPGVRHNEVLRDNPLHFKTARDCIEGNP
jgi:fermentation-respiration switch protein FrsA (DUF1100 family)